jgi:ferredoxin
MPGKIARIVVDPDVCIGSAVCIEAAPGVFQLDERSIVVNTEGATEAEIFEAAEGCPTGAISLHDADGKQIYPKK